MKFIHFQSFKFLPLKRLNSFKAAQYFTCIPFLFYWNSTRGFAPSQSASNQFNQTNQSIKLTSILIAQVFKPL